MASRTAGVGWFFVGFLAGVGATLALIIFATRPQPTTVSLPAPAVPAAPVVTYHPPQLPPPATPTAPTPAPGAPQPQAPAAAAPQAGPRAPDRQTQDDAAAAGMTSRARPAG